MFLSIDFSIGSASEPRKKKKKNGLILGSGP